MVENQRHKSVKQYVALFILLSVTGINYFFAHTQIVILSFIILLPIYLFEKNKFNYKAIAILSIFPIIELIQFIIYGQQFWTVFISNILRLAIAYFAVMIAKTAFLRIYSKIIYWFALVSLVIFFSLFLAPQLELFWLDIAKFRIFDQLFQNPINEVHPNIVVYTFNPDSFNPLRNNGPFWEPGAFAIFLVIALIFNIIRGDSIITRQNIVLIITIITTISTAGYLALFVIILGYFTMLYKGKLKFILSIVILVAGVSLYGTLEFLKIKINDNISLSYTTTGSRFGSAYADWALIVQRPIIGWGRSIEGIYKTKFYDPKIMHRNNGLTKLAANYGIPLFVLYMYLLISSFIILSKYYKTSSRFAYFAFISLIILGFSQTIFNRPYFYAFIIIPFVFKQFMPKNELTEQKVS